MLFIDTVTIFHKAQNGSYERKIVKGCYWYGDARISNSGHGIVRDDAITVFFPKKVVEENKLKIFKEDRIIKGIAEDITSVNELIKYEDRITVRTVNENNVGSNIDNLVVTGK